MNWPVTQLMAVNFLTGVMKIFYPDDFSINTVLPANVNIIENKLQIKEFDFSEESMDVARTLARNRFPDKFLFGAGSSAYQTEGAYDSYGKGKSVWDYWTHSDASPVTDKSNGDIASDSYHKYAEDIKLVQDLQANIYRFSISWSRILPHGVSNYVNIEAIKHYNNLINTMILSGITPMVTMHCYDLPEKLQLMGGWTNPLMVDYFVDYARVLFTYFGDRVKYWITINDPWKMCNMFFGDPLKPMYNDSAVSNYLCGHHVLLAHAKVYYLYRSEFHWLQKGKVGISLGTEWFEPKNSKSLDDLEATELSFQFYNYYFLNALCGEFGGYPNLVTIAVEIKSAQQRYPRSRLPSFTFEDKQMIKQSLDFLGINFFTTYNVKSIGNDYKTVDPFDSLNRNESIWHDMGSTWLPYDGASKAFEVKSTPENFGKMLQRMNNDYVLPPIFITANGYSDNGTIYDVDRALYHVNHVIELFVKMLDGIDVRSYIAWTLIDGFQWNKGYKEQFGLYAVDFEKDDRPRTAKFSTAILKNIYKSKSIVPIVEELMQS